jgi:hypothetical protein
VEGAAPGTYPPFGINVYNQRVADDSKPDFAAAIGLKFEQNPACLSQKACVLQI